MAFNLEQQRENLTQYLWELFASAPKQPGLPTENELCWGLQRAIAQYPPLDANSEQRDELASRLTRQIKTGNFTDRGLEILQALAPHAGGVKESTEVALATGIHEFETFQRRSAQQARAAAFTELAKEALMRIQMPGFDPQQHDFSYVLTQLRRTYPGDAQATDTEQLVRESRDVFSPPAAHSILELAELLKRDGRLGEDDANAVAVAYRAAHRRPEGFDEILANIESPKVRQLVEAELMAPKRMVMSNQVPRHLDGRQLDRNKDVLPSDDDSLASARALMKDPDASTTLYLRTPGGVDLASDPDALTDFVLRAGEAGIQVAVITGEMDDSGELGFVLNAASRPVGSYRLDDTGNLQSSDFHDAKGGSLAELSQDGQTTYPLAKFIDAWQLAHPPAEPQLPPAADTAVTRGGTFCRR